MIKGLGEKIRVKEEVEKSMGVSLNQKIEDLEEVKKVLSK